MKKKVFLSLILWLAVPALAQQTQQVQQTQEPVTECNEVPSTNWSLAVESLQEESLEHAENLGSNVRLPGVHACRHISVDPLDPCPRSQMLIMEMNGILEEYLSDVRAFKESREQLRRDIALAESTQQVRHLESIGREQRDILIGKVTDYIGDLERKVRHLGTGVVSYSENPMPASIEDHHFRHLQMSYHIMQENIDSMKTYRDDFLIMKSFNSVESC